MGLWQAILRPHPAPGLAERAAAVAAPAEREGGWRLQDPDRLRRAGVRPTVTVVTVCFNSARTLGDTVASVAGQSYPAIEHVVIDGGSTDGTLDLLRSFDTRVAYWRSEPDGGIYDAFNKGIALAQGDLVQILNSDDWMERDQIERGVDALLASGADFAHGDIWLHGWRGSDVRIGGDPHWERLVTRTMPAIHQATVLARRSVYERVGLFRTDLRIASDYDWFIRVAKAGLRGQHDPRIIAHMRAGGASTARQRRTIAEGFACARSNGDRLLPCAAHWTKRWLWPNGAPAWTTRCGERARAIQGRLGALRTRFRSSAVAAANAFPILQRMPGRGVVKRIVGLRSTELAVGPPTDGRLRAFIEARDLDGGLSARALEQLIDEAHHVGPVAVPAVEGASPGLRQARVALALGGAELLDVPNRPAAEAAGCRSVLLLDDAEALRPWQEFPILLVVGAEGVRVERGDPSR